MTKFNVIKCSYIIFINFKDCKSYFFPQRKTKKGLEDPSIVEDVLQPGKQVSFFDRKVINLKYENFKSQKV